MLTRGLGSTANFTQPYYCLQSYNFHRSFRNILDSDTARGRDVGIDIEFARCRHHLKAKPLYAVIEVVKKHVEVLRRGGMPGYKAIQNSLRKFMGLTITVVHWNSRTNDYVKEVVKAIPKKKYSHPKWKLVYTVATIRVANLLNIHQGRHAQDVTADEVDVSYDGVEITKSVGRSLECMSVKFTNCRTVYPVAVGIAEPQFTDMIKSGKEVMKRPLNDLSSNSVAVRHLVLDAPKRFGEFLNYLTE